MPDVYWLLLFLAGAAGWYLAYIFYNAKSKPKIPGEYLKGLNYLLNEQPDKALEVFIDLVDVDSETVETHLVLGNMFRRRGEVDRAIRIHQNLIARPALNSIYKSTALLELAKDYFKAGLLDRAEALFKDVIEIGLQTDEAYPLLLSLYEQEKEWQRAIEIAKKLEKVSGEKMNQVTAHYYCELSELEFENPDDGAVAAKRLAKKALSCDKNCARASVLLGNYAVHGENFKSAIKYYKAVSKQKPEYLPEVFMKLREAYLLHEDHEGFIEFLTKIKDTELSGISFSTLLAGPSEGNAEKKMILDWLLEKPELSLLEVNAFLKSQNVASEPLSKLGLAKIQTSVEGFIKEHASHQCKQCGFHGKALYWQCPSCHYWGTVVPIMPSLN